MHYLLILLPVFMFLLVVLPAFLGASWYFEKAKKYGRFRNEYERSLRRLCFFTLSFLVWGFNICCAIYILTLAGPYQKSDRYLELALITGLCAVVYAFGLWCSRCAVIAVRRTYPKGYKILVYLGVLLGGTLGPLGLGILSLLGFQEPYPEAPSDTPAE